MIQELDERPGTLLDATLRLLTNRQLTLPEIATGAGVPFDWLRKLASYKVKDPSVNRVQKLWEYLAGKKLPI